MKSFVLTCSLFLMTTLSCGAQTDVYYNIKKFLALNHPEVTTDNRLIAFNVWSSSDMESREENKSFEKACSVYEYAKLKGGSKGIVVVAVSKDNLSSTAVISFTKDGIHKLISCKMADIEGIDAVAKNMVFDSQGKEVYKNLPSSEIFNSIHQLITR